MLLGRAPIAHAEDFLFGAAAVTAATSAMVVPGIMAQGQVNIAQTKANTATTISAMNAQQALFQARLQSYTALAQAGVSRDIAMMGQQANTNNLLAQLQYLAYNRSLDYQMQRERMMSQMMLQNSLMNLEYKKMELAGILAQINQVSGGELTSPSTPNINSLLQSPTIQPSASLGANALANNSSASANPSLGSAESSFGLRRALAGSLSSGSTGSIRRRSFSNDLAVFRNSTAGTAEGASYGVRNSVRSLMSTSKARTH